MQILIAKPEHLEKNDVFWRQLAEAALIDYLSKKEAASQLKYDWLIPASTGPAPCKEAKKERVAGSPFFRVL